MPRTTDLTAAEAVERVVRAAELAVFLPTAAPGDGPAGALWVGRVGRGMLGDAWPFPPTGCPSVLVARAAERGWVVPADEAPRRGDVYVADAEGVGFVLGGEGVGPGHCRGVGPDNRHVVGRPPVTYLRWARALAPRAA